MNDHPHFIYWKTEALKGVQGPRAKNRGHSLAPRQPALNAHNGRVAASSPGASLGNQKSAGEDEDEIVPACFQIKWAPQQCFLSPPPSNLRSEIETTFNCRSNGSKKAKCQSPLGVFQVFFGLPSVHWSLIRHALLPSASSMAVVGVGPFPAGLGAAAERCQTVSIPKPTGASQRCLAGRPHLRGW